MAAKTFTLSAVGVTAGQALDATSTAMKISGTLNGGTLFIEASNEDDNYETVVSSIRIEQNLVSTIQLPAGWYVRTNFVGGTAPSATVIIE